ncbi:putative heme iron utilization protein [Beggiatoa alba B18LD]|uniref:Putative heme iron utilization protein n=1 Tax=Beggiatoa alba B18LD TaxID=395493 RepID=I3CGA3_9GAMM|nr:DUF2470 domain-containing protein [Beggiatoa alba]EIJ42646.1 putative heme iron utilization protein [Beggiatoa alba B18LD]
MSDKLTEARALFLDSKYGVLSTLLADDTQYPFGSIVPYCLDRQGNPLILISRLAQHSKNLIAHPKVSLTLHQATTGNVLTAPRLTCLADAIPLSTDDEDSRNRYCRYYPEGESYYKQLDFHFYRLIIKKALYIGGFGRIEWLAGDELIKPNPLTADEETQILQHMNTEHQAALRHYYENSQHVLIDVRQALTIVGIDSDGFDIQTGERLHRFTFQQAVNNVTDVRHALIAMAQV